MVDTNSIIEGTVKFRDGKKWKSRWCVMRKLSPVADCLHLQLYRDSKDRYKQGQTKASLSLQHFLGAESGFTLDKESNTIAIICQDVTVVLAFDTRERLIQWQVKIANNLGDDQQFLIQISSAPAKAKLANGPARLHVQEHRFCLTVGVPPRLVGFWEIRQLRRYGVVESRFCFEGGSRCGRGEGLYVLLSDQGEEITRCFHLASEGKLSSRRRPVARNMSVMDSPRKNMHSRAETRISDISCIESLMLRHQHDQTAMNETSCGCSTRHQSHEDLLVWPSSETRPDSCDYGDTASVGEFPDNHIQECGVWTNENSLERCASCISKLGALSRSSTTANTPGTGFMPAWTIENNGQFNCRHHIGNVMNPSVTRSSVSVSSHGSGSGSGTGSGSNSGSANSDYSVPRLSTTDCWSSRGTSPASVIDRCQCCPPSRPPKSAQLTLQSSTNTGSPLKKKPKPPMPLPAVVSQSSCTCHHPPPTPVTNPYDNYDVPKLTHIKEEKPSTDYRTSPCLSSDDYYDTPKNIKENLIGEYGNYDTPPSATAVRQSCVCTNTHNQNNHQCSRTVIDRDDMRPVVCPCQRVMCWAENWMMLPYCRRGNGIENTSAPIHKVKLSGEGKMPVVNSSGEIAIYATVDKSKKTRCKNAQPRNEDELNTSAISNRTDKSSKEDTNDLNVDNISSNYVNVEVSAEKQSTICAETKTTTVHDSSIPSDTINYMNIDFAHSLEYYENAKDVLSRTGISQQEFDEITHEIASTPAEEKTIPFSFDKNGVKVCNKCGHACPSNNGPPAPQNSQPQNTKQDDYLMMEPAANHKPQNNSVQDLLNRSLPNKNFPGYLPMHPITNTGSVSKPDLLKLRLNKDSNLLGEKAASIPSLSAPIVDRCRKRSEAECQRIPGSAMLGLNHSASATSSPYLKRHIMSYINDKEDTRFNNLARKRSSSADSTRYLDDLESITERTVSSSPTRINHSEGSKNTSIDSLSSHTLSFKRTNEVPTSNANSLSNIPPCVDEIAIGQEVNSENQSDPPNEILANNSLRTLVQECLDQQGSPASVHIRRSSSVPCKSGNNRDSSSSNDSGVSTGSLKHRGADFAEFELPLTTSMSTRRHHHAVTQRLNANNHIDCLHASLPRRSKSSDPLRELTFQFQKIKIPAKSSSAEAEIPVFPQKRDRKGYISPSGDGAMVVPYIDSRSTSSGTSDMSDYIETLSLSSHSSSDTPEYLRLGRTAATTLRPRSGKEYHKIDRYILEGDLKKSPYTNITPVPEKSESPSPGYMSGSPGQ
uniref:Uncharacterized protein n=2 Tax=Clastoptera arizonana TaxID=38151 RepID=A0A1B6CQJ2_9HEMI